MKVIYHGNCPDGFGSALVAWREYKSEAEYVPAYHNVDPLPMKDDDLLMVDFCYNYETMAALQSNNKSLTVIDHHTGMFPVLERLSSLQNVSVYKDQKHSGAVLMWKHIHGDKPVPKLLQFIEDRDCHFNKIPEAEAALMWLDTHPFKFELWDTFLKFEDHVWDKIINFNKPMVKKYRAMINRAADQSVKTKLAGYPARICFGTEEQASDIASEMAIRCNGIGIVGVVQTNGIIKTSLRSVGIDLVPIAQALKGNGHSYAAAFPANPIQLSEMLKGQDILACTPQQMFLGI